MLDASMGSTAAIGGTVAGAAIGAAGGAALGMGLSSVATTALKNTTIKEANTIIPKAIPLIGGKKIPESIIKAGVHSPKVRGFGAVGAIAGLAIGGSAYMRGYVNRNRDFMESNPYNRGSSMNSRGSSMQASSTGAYGDIVLGMHNSRRG